jgi:hypothetical protein
MQRILTAAVVLAGALAAADARAQWGFPGYGGYGFGYGYGYNGYSIYDQDRLPYFALHPPVYYSYPPVPRTFGYSPFAYPGWIKTPEYANVADPQTIVNPYFDDGAPVPVAPGIEASPVIPGNPAGPAPKAAPPVIKKSQFRATPGPNQAVEAKPLRIVNPHFNPLVSLRANEE